jgi:hypothetical protein
MIICGETYLYPAKRAGKIAVCLFKRYRGAALGAAMFHDP